MSTGRLSYWIHSGRRGEPDYIIIMLDGETLLRFRDIVDFNAHVDAAENASDEMLAVFNQIAQSELELLRVDALRDQARSAQCVNCGQVALDVHEGVLICRNCGGIQ
jgi:hypothetical protein